MKSAELALKPEDINELIIRADRDGNGVLEYAEFVPLAAEIINTLRVRELTALELDYQQNMAEVQARASLFGASREEITAMCVEAFNAADTDGNGRLSREEFFECLNSLKIRSTTLTKREMNMLLLKVDEDNSGTVEVSEFAPLMFDYLVEMLALSFMHAGEASELEKYLNEVFTAADEAKGGEATNVLTVPQMKAALADADRLQLSSVQILSVVSEAPADHNGGIDYPLFIRHAATLIQRMQDPTLKLKANEVSKRAVISPLQTMTEEQKASVQAFLLQTFKKHDADGSGKLDPAEFYACLQDASLGLSPKQIKFLSSASDQDGDGLIDYPEFANLCVNFLLDLAREDAIAKAYAPAAAEMSPAEAVDELIEAMFSFKILFDSIGGGGGEHGIDEVVVDAAALLAFMKAKAAEWPLSPLAFQLLFAELETKSGKLTWNDFRGIVESIEARVQAEPLPS